MADPLITALGAALTLALVVLFVVLVRQRGLTAEAAERLASAREASARLDQAQARVTGLEGEVAALREAKVAAERDAALARQTVETANKQMADWEKTKAATIEAAKAAALASSRELSSKLIEDHKSECKAANEAAEKRVTETTKALLDQFAGVTKAVASLNDQVGETRGVVDTVWRALSTPGGAGHFAEIGLENTLKEFGLEAGRDFIMQYTVWGAEDGRRLRPDAVVFLPADSLLVIDSKASKFLLEIAEAAEDSGAEEAAYANLARTMNGHLKALAGKDYRGAVLEAAGREGRKRSVRRLLNVMYLPNEAAVEKVKHADAEFVRKAAKEEIIVTGPTGLASLVAFARVEIDLGRQAENRERIVEATRALLESVAVMVGHVEAVGRGVRSSADAFSKLAGSINGRLLPRARTLVDLGVRPTRKRTLPASLPTYQLIIGESVIEGEAEPVTDPPALPDK